MRALREALARRERVLLLLDFDGTLCEIKPRPAQARLSRRRRGILGRLAAGPLRVAVLSGRSVEDLRLRVGLSDVIYGGNYGLELRGLGVDFVHREAAAGRGRLAALRAKLSASFRDIPGALVEGKGLSLALHYRGVAPRRLREFRSRVAALRGEGGSAGFRWVKGDRAWEVLPDCAWGKREAALLLWRRLGKPYLLVVADSADDEEMFSDVADRGAAVRVGGRRASLAPYRLRNVAEVYRFLTNLAERML